MPPSFDPEKLDQLVLTLFSVSARVEQAIDRYDQRLDALDGLLRDAVIPKLQVTADATTRCVDEVLEVREQFRKLRLELPCLPRECPISLFPVADAAHDIPKV